MGEKVDKNGFRTTTIHVPQTKASYTEGEDLYWAKQDGSSDPESALQRHLKINNPDIDFHLFGYPDKEGVMIPLIKTNFLKRLSSTATAAGLPRMPGHSIRIGSTVEYLLRGLPFDIVKVKGRWNSDVFHKYIRDHIQILAPYMQQASSDTSDDFVRIAVPSTR